MRGRVDRDDDVRLLYFLVGCLIGEIALAALAVPILNIANRGTICFLGIEMCKFMLQLTQRFLFFDHIAADGTFFPCRDAVLRAGRRLFFADRRNGMRLGCGSRIAIPAFMPMSVFVVPVCRIPIMSCFCNFRNRGKFFRSALVRKNLVTVRTSPIFGIARLRTGCRNCRMMFHVFMRAPALTGGHEYRTEHEKRHQHKHGNNNFQSACFSSHFSTSFF